MLLPNKDGYQKLNVHFDRPIHDGGHLKYNDYLRQMLDNMFKEDKINPENLCELNINLRQSLRHLDVPWY